MVADIMEVVFMAADIIPAVLRMCLTIVLDRVLEEKTV